MLVCAGIIEQMCSAMGLNLGKGKKMVKANYHAADTNIFVYELSI